MLKKSLKDIDVSGKRVFCRVDFNVPLSQEGFITDDTRIRASLPTIEYLVSKGAKVILATHLGRPKGQRVKSLKVDCIAERLGSYLGQEILKLDKSMGVAVKQVNDLEPGRVVLLENVRFHPGEERNSTILSNAFARLADVYVNDAFGLAHRTHASNVGISKIVPGVMGFLLEREVKALTNILESPTRPFLAIIGGAKVKDKIGVIRRLLPKVDALLLGGGLAFTFLFAKGMNIGNSLIDYDKVELAREIMMEAGDKLFLPIDVVTARDMNSKGYNVGVSCIPGDSIGLDIGEETQKLFASLIFSSKTILWNGPMGLFEKPDFAIGTYKVAKAVANANAITIVGGGDSVAALNNCGVLDRITHVSTGGGASLKFLEGLELPGISCLSDINSNIIV